MSASSIPRQIGVKHCCRVKHQRGGVSLNTEKGEKTKQQAAEYCLFFFCDRVSVIFSLHIANVYAPLIYIQS